MSYLIDFLGGIKRRSAGNLFAQTSSSTIANSATETTIIDGGDGSLTLPANFFRVGRSLKIHARGIHSSTGNPTLTLKVKLGSTVISTATFTSGNGSNDAWALEVDLTCRSTGASGVIMGVGEFKELHTTGADAGFVDQAATINTANSQVLSVTAQWGTADAGNVLTTQIFLLDAKN